MKSGWQRALGITVSLVVVSVGVVAQDKASTPEPLQLPGIENAFRLSPRLYSGGQPQSPESLAALKELGITTIVSVDGSAPDVESARKLGLHYVHLPIGYDGVDREQALRIIKATQTVSGPVFIHCHHGKHRGPTAAALSAMVIEGWDKAQAIAWMRVAGTSPDYPGLFATVNGFVSPTAQESAEVSNVFPERAKTPPLVDMMVAIDATWDRIKACREAGFTTPANQPDLKPAHEAKMLVEHFLEVARLPEAQRKGADFARALDASRKLAAELESSLRQVANGSNAETRSHAERLFQRNFQACSSCHATNRDR